jgi:hypothetical protein
LGVDKTIPCDNPTHVIEKAGAWRIVTPEARRIDETVT